METALIHKEYKLERFPGKGGWTYAVIPEIVPGKHSPFGWVRVKGSIDGFEIKHYHLMPMGNGSLFLPVKAEIRKKIGKQEGDWVQVILFADETPQEIPEELLLCLSEEPVAHRRFLSFTESEQKAYLDWIYSAKREETRIERIAQSINMLLEGRKIPGKGD